MNKFIKSPLRYPGGKSRAVPQITAILPEAPFEEYREPFVGGASLFFSLKQAFPTKMFWINDLYYDLFMFWRVSQLNLPAVIDQINLWKNEFPEGKKLFNYTVGNINRFNPIQKAAAFFILNRITFSGTTLSGGYSQEAFEKRFTPSSVQRLENVGKILYNTTITNLDYQPVVEAGGEKVFIFLDPPYFSAAKSALYGVDGDHHKPFDHERFAEVMKQCPHDWLITYDDSPYIRKLFSFAPILRWNQSYGMTNVGAKSSEPTGKEIFIANYFKR